MSSSLTAVTASSTLPGILGWCIRDPYKALAAPFVFFALFVLATAAPRIALESHPVTGDGFYYFCYARSLFFDHDVNFRNEYHEFGPVCMGRTRFPMSGGDQQVGARPEGVLPGEAQPSKAPTPYGPWGGEFRDYPGNMWEMGSGLLWLPFIAVAHAATLTLNAAGLTTLPADGYSILYQCAVGVAASFYAFLGACLVYKAIRLRFGPEEAFFAVAFLVTATALVCYLVYQVAYSHSQEFFASALVFYLVLRCRSFDDMSYRYAALLGLAVGLTAIVRWQMALWGLVPLVLWLRDLATSRRKVATLLKGVLLGAAACGAFAPQMLAWHRIYGSYITMPMDNDFGRRFLMLRFKEAAFVLFSNNHGMFFWHPMTFVGFLGAFAALFSRATAGGGWRPVIALSLVVFALETFVNGMVPDWWGGSSFGMRRMIGLYPLIGFGLAALLSALGAAKARLRWVLGGWAALSSWNAALLFIWIFHLGGRALPH